MRVNLFLTTSRPAIPVLRPNQNSKLRSCRASLTEPSLPFIERCRKRVSLGENQRPIGILAQKTQILVAKTLYLSYNITLRSQLTLCVLALRSPSYVIVLVQCWLFYDLEMTRHGYNREISQDDEKASQKVSFVSYVLFQWMNRLFETGKQLALEQSDFFLFQKKIILLS